MWCKNHIKIALSEFSHKTKVRTKREHTKRGLTVSFKNVQVYTSILHHHFCIICMILLFGMTDLRILVMIAFTTVVAYFGF